MSLSDVSAATDLRRAIRSLAAALIAGEPLDADDLAAVNRRVAQVPRWRELTVGADGVPDLRYRSTAAGAAAAIAEIAADAVTVLGEHWYAVRLAACAAPGCMALFLRDDPDRTGCSPRCASRLRAITST